MRPRPPRQPPPRREIGGVHRKWTGRLPVALVFPNRYRVGMANLGVQVVYGLLHRHPGVVAERFFVPDPGRPFRSEESSRPLADFPVILFSCSFEADYPAVPALLAAGGVAPLAAARAGQDRAPLVLAGGVATMVNPEVLAPVVDGFLLGEAEAGLDLFVECLLTAGAAAGLAPAGRQALLHDLARRVPGCYVPSRYQVTYDDDGRVNGFAADPGAPPLPIPVPRAPSSAQPGHSHIVAGDAEFRDTFLVELGRGCSRACRFCAAGFVYRPPRQYDAQAIAAVLGLRPSGVDRVGLVGLEMVSDQVLAQVTDQLLAQGCRLSFSSLRADRISDGLLQVLRASGVKTAVLAPDGGSQRLRRVINKQLSVADVLTAAEELVAAGVTTLKLYFMIGLPTETDTDLEELIDLLVQVQRATAPQVRCRRKALTITASVSCFVPKPWTPFQFAAMAPLAELRRRLDFLRRHLRDTHGIRLQAEKPEHALAQAVLARGDRRLGHHLDLFGRGNLWRRLAKAGVDPTFYACRERGADEILPWETVDHRIRKEYLWQEYQRALAGRPTPACQVERCRRCGVCPPPATPA